MNLIRRTLDSDADTGARLRELAAEHHRRPHAHQAFRGIYLRTG